MKYRKKPVVIKAMKTYIGMKLSDLYNFTEGNVFQGICGNFYIRTLEGDMLVNAGDYIIKGIQGEFYPCKPDIFEQTYEKVED